MGKRQCSFCGAFNPDTAQICSNCRESLVAASHAPSHGGFSPESLAQIRRGVLYILLAAVLYYFFGGHSGIEMPVQISPIVNTYLVPFMFLCGAGLILLGLFRGMRG
jgi:hypothetical protein